VVFSLQSEPGVLLEKLLFKSEKSFKSIPTLYFDSNHNGLRDKEDVKLPIKIQKGDAGLTELHLQEPLLFLTERIKMNQGNFYLNLQSYNYRHYVNPSSSDVQPLAVPTLYSFLLEMESGYRPQIAAQFRNSVSGNLVAVKWDKIDLKKKNPVWGRADYAARMQRLFPSVFEDERKAQRLVWEGDVELNEMFVVEDGDTLELRPGTTVKLGPDASVMVFGEIKSMGTKEAPILFTRQREDQEKWGVIALNNAKGTFEHTIIEYGNEARLRHIYYSGALSSYNSDLNFVKSTIRLSQGEDGLNVKHGVAKVLGSVFEENASDALDYDFVTESSYVKDSVFIKNGNDGVDLGSALIEVSGNRMESNGDKGLSVGGDSLVNLSNNIIRKNLVGMAVKDSSRVEVLATRIEENKIGLGVYVKNRDYKLYNPYVKVSSGVIKGNDLNVWKSGKVDYVVAGGEVEKNQVSASKFDFNWNALFE